MTNARIESSAPPTSTKKTANPLVGAPEGARAFLTRLFAAAVRAVDPASLVATRLQRAGDRLVVAGSAIEWSGPTVVVGAGKASPRMAAAAAKILADELAGGAVIAPREGQLRIPKIECLVGGHPLPTPEGERSTRALLELLDQNPTAAVLAVISGGASSLMVQPTPPVELADKIAVNRKLLGSGAEIHEFNTVRKHLSQVKGGGLVRRARGRPFTALIISDVIGDDPGTIGSGPSAPDTTTFADAIEVLERYRLTAVLPASVVRVLEQGRRGERPETLKPGAPELQGVSNIVVGSNRSALTAAAVAARASGYEPIVCAAPLSGDTSTAARSFVDWIRATPVRAAQPTCWLAGGETTVQLDDAAGRGGRNQEFALICATELAGTDLYLLSAGTDGIDGPTDAAGAFADATTLARGRRQRLDHEVALRTHDSYRYFDALGDLFRTGPTGTNVMDIKIAVAGVPS